ncbi:hypothetical protein [Streptomyces sp. NPDC048489]|uniref:hypothetical protein n=1 Tax=Streptomyces sp. NPDC048489 TaxID=3154504 RepID=UPI00341DDD78
MRLIDLAVRQALRSRCRYRVGALIVAGNRVLAWSPNIPRNSPTVDYSHATFHAEEAVLRRVQNASGAVAYIARVNRSGETLLARPCPRCQQALAAAGVAKARYTTGPMTTDIMSFY